MRVKEIMTAAPRTCTPDASLAEAANLMWESDCGVLPVVDDGELVGIVTDRDMFIALGTRNTRAAHLRVGAVATTKVSTCSPDDEVEAALATMKEARVRRLPVVDTNRKLIGILSLNDIALLLAITSPCETETWSMRCKASALIAAGRQTRLQRNQASPWTRRPRHPHRRGRISHMTPISVSSASDRRRPKHSARRRWH